MTEDSLSHHAVPGKPQASFYEIGRRCGTDKCGPHGYHEWYERHLEPIRNHPIKLLEIGILGGASLRLWEEYLPNAEIFGVDTDEKCERLATPRIKILTGNQGDPVFLKELSNKVGPVDVLVDDGGHFMDAQQTSLRELLPLVKVGGFYVIEDIETSYYESYGGGPRGSKGTTIDMLKSALDDLNERYHRSSIILPVRISEMHVYRNIVFMVRGE